VCCDVNRQRNNVILRRPVCLVAIKMVSQCVRRKCSRLECTGLESVSCSFEDGGSPL